MAKKTVETTIENLDTPVKKSVKAKSGTRKTTTSNSQKDMATASKTAKKTAHTTHKPASSQETTTPAPDDLQTHNPVVAPPAKVNSSKTAYLIVLAVCILGVCLLAWRHWAPISSTSVEPVASVSPDQSWAQTLPAGSYIATTTMTDDQGEIDVGTLFAILGVADESESRIVLNIDGQGHATMTVFGEQDTFSYDETYFYTSDGAVLSYTWDGQKLAIKEELSTTTFVPEADYVPPQLDDETLQAMDEFMQSLESSVQP
ncbi:hypothetical protein IJJ08_04210 [bacterium]|nr:hypothetical protein [bacterium]